MQIGVRGGRTDVMQGIELDSRHLGEIQPDECPIAIY